MSTLRNLDKPTAVRYIARIVQLGGIEEEEANPRLLCRYRIKNSVVKIYESKNGYTLYCNSLPTFNQIVDPRQIDIEFTDHVQFDDSGWGNPFGGIVIVALHEESGRLLQREVGVKFFQQPLYDQKEYLRKVVDRCVEMLVELKVPKATTLIKCCTGFVFRQALRHFVDEGYYVVTEKITGKLQDYAERRYREYLNELGIPARIADHPADNIADRLGKVEEIINYLRDHGELHPFCKTGWKALRSTEGNEST